MAADHLRAEIKAYIRAKLANRIGNSYPTDLQNRVEINRFDALQDQAEQIALPAARIYFTEESAEDVDNVEVRITNTLEIEIITEGSTADAQIDLISGQIMRLLRNDWQLGGLVERIKYTKGSLGYDEKVKRDNVSWTMTYEVRYILPSVPDDTELDPFALMHVDMRQPTSTDEIPLEQ